MGFTKLDSGIVFSSVWGESLTTRVVWVTLLALADCNGMVKCSRSGLLRSSNVDQDEFDKAIITLESPDPDSRSPEYDGRRIEKCEGGWKVLNHGKYRAYTYSDSKDAVRQRRHREKTGVTQGVTCHEKCDKGRDISASVSVSSSDSEKREDEEKKESISLEFAEFWEAYPRKIGKVDSFIAFSALRTSVSLLDISKGFNGYMDYLKSKRIK
jgi:hypothetical protein